MVTSVTIENVIKRSCINLHVKGRNKKEIIGEMADVFGQAGVLASRDLFIQVVCEREGEGPAGIGNQVATPHGKSDAVLKTAMAVDRVDQGVEWGILRERDTRAFVMFAINSEDKSELVSPLSRVAVAPCDDDVIETLLTAENEEEMFTLFNRKGETRMRVVGIAAYTAGITHTYMAREKLVKGAKTRDHKCRVKTQGIISTEYKLTEQETTEADVMILAVGVRVSGEERFKEKPVIRVGTAATIKNTIGLIKKVEKTMENKG